MIRNRGIYVKHPASRDQSWVGATFTMVGASGGNGGNDSAAGYSGYPGNIITGVINVNLNSKMTMVIGTGGSTGASGAHGYGYGPGGTNRLGYNGGRGGNAGGGGSSGSGGGGGAATVLIQDDVITAVAGGGGGGGGGGNGPVGLASEGQYVSTIYGGDGPDKGGDGGGGGGGGGGYQGGAGGSLVGGDSGAHSGTTGSDLLPAAWNSSSSAMAPSSGGYVEISYSSITGNPYFTGGAVTVGNTVLVNSIPQTSIKHRFDNDGTFVGLGPLSNVGPPIDWQEAMSMSFKHTGSWNNIKEAYIKKDGLWQKLFPSSGTMTISDPGTYTFKVPGGVHSLTYSGTGAGGGGGAGEGTNGGEGGGGGGAGGYATAQTLDVTPGQVLTITVGTGGSGGSGTSQPGVAYAGRSGGATAIISGSSVTRLSGGGGGAGGNTPPPGRGGGGGKIICRKLAELGYFDQHMNEADQQFGSQLRDKDPNAYYGYLRWAQTVVDLMEGNGSEGLRKVILFWERDTNRRIEIQKNIVIYYMDMLARPWAEEMAYRMGAEGYEKSNSAGKIIMNIGLPLCRKVGKIQSGTKLPLFVKILLIWSTVSILLASVTIVSGISAIATRIKRWFKKG
jgi:hypothetical protein